MHVRLRNPDRVERLNGPKQVREVLDELDINPTTVLVIRDGQLLTHETSLDDRDEIEIRPVISGGAGAPRCATCGASAVIEEPRHRSAWCGAHYGDHVHNQIRKAIDQRFDGVRMFSYGDRLLVAVSGGKDSLALWHALIAMGYRVDGLYVGLGIGGYSKRSLRVCREFDARHVVPRGLQLHVVDMEAEYGYSTPSGADAARRSTCGVCGLSKRYIFNRFAVEHDYDVMLTGHNLDDEAATLLGNVLRWKDEFLTRQAPVLPATGANQVRKCKPLYRLSEREMAAYCVVEGIDYVVEECPLVAGNTSHEQKAALNLIEQASPGSKAQFLFGFLDREAQRWASAGEGDAVELVPCAECGMPT
ncbi:MAG: ATP-binding protein, partial [Nitriliruptorales bacterium]|nr:ATP-binding protein [Nitriliruptorales bacterium]